MGRIVENRVHGYGTKSFDAHVYSIQKRLAKALSREKVYLTVIFVGETHNTIDERRRAQLYGFRPSSGALLTVVERGMGLALGGPNLVVESATNSLSSLDSRRDDNVVGQIASAYNTTRFKAIFILFGEDHEKKFRPRMEANPSLPEMVWHFYPSFHDHITAVHRVYPPSDPRFGGYTLMGMIRLQGKSKLDLMQLAEGIMPTAGTINLAVMSPFDRSNSLSKFALFVRDPLMAQLQANLDTKRDKVVMVSSANIRDIRVLDVEGRVRPVAAELQNDSSRQRLIEEFWADAL